ncbi:MAG TPA: pyridoxamine 5'-phosphate oxidase family protein [Candidatus Saccharimonadales bacterium]|nr:pyridoxamine 5'-phosphate oxidase family protein [Candidatus Saccharimonadales bacterium]
MNDRTSTATDASEDLRAVAALLAELDICMFTSRAEDGSLHGRPMSNNGDVEYDGDSWFFAREGSRKVVEVDADPHVELGFIATERATWVNVEGEATVVRGDEQRKRDLWQDEFKRWFEDGPDDPEVVLIKVSARHIDAWSAEDERSFDVAR